MMLALGFSMVLPRVFGARLGQHAADAQAVVMLLGASLALQLAFDVYHGVISGCHRWDLHNAINAGFYALIVAGMIVAVANGGGLASLALVNFVGVVFTELTRRAVARRVCPELRIRLRAASRGEMRRLLVFGAKSSVDGLAGQVLFQGNSILIASIIGPAALAVYSRSFALVRHVENLVNKFAHVLTPMASSLQAQGQQDKLRALLLDSGRIASCLTFPMVVGLTILGTPLLRLWMGPRYEHGLVLAILAIGSCLAISQRPAMTILIGMNLHGRMSFVNLALSAFGLGFSALAVGDWGWGLPGAALGLALARCVGRGLLIPAFACRRLGVPLSDYARGVALAPALYVLPFALVLGAIRALLAERPLAALLCAAAFGSLALLPVYWFRVLTEDQRRYARELLSRRIGALSASAAT
jgi:O-antigen/teichoic acid export membrane protein